MLKSYVLALLSLATTLADSPPPINKYYLKTIVISGDKTKDGLYATPYHIYAGGNDVVFLPTPSYKGFLNDTYQQFDLGTTFPWGLTLTHPQDYTQWLTAEIDVGYGDTGFALGTNGLNSSNPEWKGWLVCDWWHGAPQLFWEYDYDVVTLPSSCAKVKLMPDYC